MTLREVVLAAVAAAIALRMVISLRRIVRGIGAARREAEVWRRARGRPTARPDGAPGAPGEGGDGDG